MAIGCVSCGSSVPFGPAAHVGGSEATQAPGVPQGGSLEHIENAKLSTQQLLEGVSPSGESGGVNILA